MGRHENVEAAEQRAGRLVRWLLITPDVSQEFQRLLAQEAGLELQGSDNPTAAPAAPFGEGRQCGPSGLSTDGETVSTPQPQANCKPRWTHRELFGD
jgi:hypothetical protein